MTDLAAFLSGVIVSACIIIYAAVCANRSGTKRTKQTRFTHLLK